VTYFKVEQDILQEKKKKIVGHDESCRKNLDTPPTPTFEEAF